MEFTGMEDRAIWELQNMKRALETFEVLNTPEENQRLAAVRAELHKRYMKTHMDRLHSAIKKAQKQSR